MSRRTLGGCVLAVACLVLTACGVSMPDSGPVHEMTTTGSNRDDQPARIDPPSPRKGASPEEIVAGFLDAMQETPAVTTSVARQFLTKEAADNWQPHGMTIYGGVIGPRGNNKVEVKLVDADRTDDRGAWLGPATAAESTLDFPMAFEDGEYRISQPPDNLLVPTEWFAARFRQVSLYFFDPTAKILIPEPVFVPRGLQFASALVNALLQGPSIPSEQSFFPSGLRSVVSVTVSKAGVAQVDLTSDTSNAAMPSAPQSELLVSQLAWTLQQDPTIAKFGVTIDGRTLQLPGESEFSVDHGHQYAPYVAGSSTQLFGLRDGLMVGGSPQNLATVTGPFGRRDYHLRTVSPDMRADQVAAVNSRGSTLWLGSVKDDGKEPTRLLRGQEDLLRPAWDFMGRVWEVDRRKTGAVVYYLHKDEMVPLDVPGISGQDVKHFLVSRDGTRLVAVVRQTAEDDAIVVSRILSTGDGQVAAAQAVDDITDPGQPESPIRDIAWRSPTSLAVLRPVDHELLQVYEASVDGANLNDLSVPVDGSVVSLAGIPVPGEKIYAFAPATADNTSAVLIDLAGPRANQIDIDPPVTFLAYTG
ncbi:MAG TPA: LpqB family beta-propeller domain-containing protein [Nocardioides sp.]|nr:LpqB family beta-propeller domain-containing protein [Nocardioides sp.]